VSGKILDEKYRYEIKFVVNESALSGFYSWLYVNTSCRKKYPDRIVNSIYFDDVDYSSVKDNLSGIPNRIKTRLRWYDHENIEPILEQKIKNGRLGMKHIVPIDISSSDILNLSCSEIVDIMIKCVPKDHLVALEYLIPTLKVSYLRKYFENARGLRVTIDDNIDFQGNLSMHRLLGSSERISFKSKVIELKFKPEMKDFVSNLIRPLRLTPVRNSKYLTGLAMTGQVNYL